MTFLKGAVEASNKIASGVIAQPPNELTGELLSLADRVIYETLLDPSFSEVVEREAKLHVRDASKINEVLSDYRKYGAFLARERQLLTKLGVQEDAINLVFAGFRSVEGLELPTRSVDRLVARKGIPQTR